MAKRISKLPNRSALSVIHELKRSNGLSVMEISARLDMSYMGVKAQCLSLEKSGHLTSRNQHQENGRPRLIYRLTAKGQSLFEKEDQQLAISLLNEARGLFGAASAEKLLFLHFQKKTADYLRQIPADAPWEERLKSLAALRDAEGHMSRVEAESLVESHAPLSGLFDAFPSAMGMEETMVSKALGRSVTRHQENMGDHYQIRFEAFRCRAGEP